MQYDVIGIGVSTLDLLMVVDELPGDESVQRAHQSVLQGGGPVATAMVTLARLGARTAMIDRVGDDWRGNLILGEFQHDGVATDLIAVVEGRSSSIASVLVRATDGARSIIYSPGDTGELSPAELPEVPPSCKILHLNGRHLEACLALARKAKGAGVMVSFDGGAHRYTSQLNELIQLTDICIVARQFACAYSGENAVETAADRLLRAGPQVVVITAGIEGSWVSEKGAASFHQPAFEVEKVVDTTGAGDAYHGGFLFALTRGYGLRSCALLASAVAAINTQKIGGRSALPSFDEAVAFLAERGLSLDQ